MRSLFVNALAGGVLLLAACPPDNPSDGGRGDAFVPAVDGSHSDNAAGDDRARTDAGAQDVHADANADAAAAPDAAPIDAGHDADHDAGSDAAAADAALTDAALTDAATADRSPGWPFDAAIPASCAANPPDTGGTSWSGWGNYQWPPEVTDQSGGSVEPGETTGQVYGQVWCEGETDQAGQAAGWSAELAVGPLGTLPTGQGWCWDYLAASFNTDSGNNDEYHAQVAAVVPGLYSLYFRYRPDGGAWLYGDRSGSDGLQVDQAGVLVVHGWTRDRLVVATLNLRCRIDAWAERRPLVVAALAAIDPDLVGFEEDCAAAGGAPQSEEIRADLAALTGRGYVLQRASAHPAVYTEGTFDEGVTVLSALPVEAARAIDLPPTPPAPPALFQRKAVAVDVTVGGTPLRFYVAHLEVGGDNVSTRQGQAAVLVADLPTDRSAIVVGDFNATPDEPAIATMTGALVDSWASLNPADPGPTMPASLPTRRIDYIFVSSALAGRVVGSRILDDHTGAIWLSDHRGVAVAIGWR